MVPEYLGSSAALGGGNCTMCTSCAICAVCLGDGPLPDFEGLGITALLSLAGLLPGGGDDLDPHLDGMTR